MMKNFLVLLSVVMMSFGSVNAQKDSNWLEGTYYDKNGGSESGLIAYAYSQKPTFRFKAGAKQKERKIKAADVIGFQIGDKKFITMNNFKQDSKEAASANIPIDFVEVIETGMLNLYKHYGKVYSGGDSYSSTHGSSLGAGSSNIVETYLVRDKETGAVWTIYSKPEKMKEQLITLFKTDEVLLFKISQGEVQYSDLPELVKNYNNSFKSN